MNWLYNSHSYIPFLLLSTVYIINYLGLYSCGSQSRCGNNCHVSVHLMQRHLCNRSPITFAFTAAEDRADQQPDNTALCVMWHLLCNISLITLAFTAAAARADAAAVATFPSVLCSATCSFLSSVFSSVSLSIVSSLSIFSSAFSSFGVLLSVAGLACTLIVL